MTHVRARAQVPQSEIGRTEPVGATIAQQCDLAAGVARALKPAKASGRPDMDNLIKTMGAGLSASPNSPITSRIEPPGATVAQRATLAVAVARALKPAAAGRPDMASLPEGGMTAIELRFAKARADFMANSCAELR